MRIQLAKCGLVALAISIATPQVAISSAAEAGTNCTQKKHSCSLLCCLVRSLFGCARNHYEPNEPSEATPQSETPPAADAGQEGGVVLLDPGVPLNAEDIIVTSATLLRSGNFRSEVVAEVQERYYGYMVPATQSEGRWRFRGPVQGFTANYGSSNTGEWPDATPFLYEDSRGNIAALSAMLPDTDVPEATNLRIYHYPARVGYSEGQYVTDDTLVFAYLNPENGRRSSFAYRRRGDDHELYRYEAGRIPGSATETSIVSLMEVATTDTIQIPILFINARVAVPRNSYSAGVFRVFAGRNYDGSDTPMGPPVHFSGIERNQANAPFEAALQAHRENRSLTQAEFASVYQFIQQAHRYLIEPAANSPSR